MAKREPITYADARTDLPQSDFAKRLAELRISRLFAANGNDRSETPEPRQSKPKTMVEEDRPHPVLRPSPAFAADVDAQSYNARLDEERRRAAQPQTPSIYQPQTGDRPMSDDQNPNRPAETLREGMLKAAIWRNESENGAYHSVTVARTYKDRDGNLQDTSSFRAKDMLSLSELARRAHHSAHDHDRTAFKEQRMTEQTQAQSKDHGKSR